MRTLNCIRAARMISLYVAGDLVGTPEREVGAHLAVCERCRGVADEFSESSSLLAQACAPPDFDAEFYSRIRHAVIGKIAHDRMPLRPSLFRRRWLYATALAAIVIASGVMLQHFSRARRDNPQDPAFASLVSSQPASGLAIGANAASSPQSSEQPPRPRKAQRPQLHSVGLNARRGSKQFEPVRKPDTLDIAQAVPDKRPRISPAMQATNVEPVSLGPATLSGGSPSSPSGRAPAPQVSRIEIQTADPNIRIIWLAPQESRGPEETRHDQDQPENGNQN